MCAVTENVPTPEGTPVPVATAFDESTAKGVFDSADSQPYTRVRHWTDQGGRRPSRPVAHPSTVLEVDLPKSSL